MFDNAIKYNPKDNEIHQLALAFKKMLEESWALNKQKLPLNCALASNKNKTPAAKATSAAVKSAGTLFVCLCLWWCLCLYELTIADLRLQFYGRL